MEEQQVNTQNSTQNKLLVTSHPINRDVFASNSRHCKAVGKEPDPSGQTNSQKCKIYEKHDTYTNNEEEMYKQHIDTGKKQQ